MKKSKKHTIHNTQYAIHLTLCCTSWQLVLLVLAFYLSGCAGGSFTIQGTITDDLAQPSKVKGATVKATMLQATGDQQLLEPIEVVTGDDGSYRLAGLKAGQYKIEVLKEGYDSPAPKTEVFIETRTGVDIPLRKQLSLTGVVYDTDGETPVFEANVNVETPSGVISRQTDSNGEFTVEKLYRDEVYTIKAFYIKGRQIEKRDVRLEEIQQPLKLVLVDPPAPVHRSDELEEGVQGKPGVRK